ncbi:MAG: tRNA (adenosine(37)-N6)-dimethylallyltransferase MiaA [Bacteroidales bacterium]|jgi:tRNA dimethylallyltransferase|nr:tRNA (adenosine(37)-N6)-dimethylallyltransferase MiaA [Bacteroidales bacterium]
MNPYNLLVILGATASGKTAVAAQWAARHGGEIISADSRQVYRDMTIGTGKDYADYVVNGVQIPCHCMDIADAGEQYNVYQYQQDFLAAFADISGRGKIPVLCGGSGLYIEAALKGYQLLQTPINEELRQSLAAKDDCELESMLAGLKTMHNHSDTITRKRMIRAIEIATYQQKHPVVLLSYPNICPLIIGIYFVRETQRQRITARLQQRLDAGMLDEVHHLLETGITPEQLEYYGLEYKFLTLFLTGKLTYDEMFRLLNTAIHQFAKRQMTWFRRMERNGDVINWLPGSLSMEEKMQKISDLS